VGGCEGKKSKGGFDSFFLSLYIYNIMPKKIAALKAKPTLKMAKPKAAPAVMKAKASSQAKLRMGGTVAKKKPCNCALKYK